MLIFPEFPEWLAVERTKTETEKLLNAAEDRLIRAAKMYEWAIEQGDRNWITEYTLQLDRADAEVMRLFRAVQIEQMTANIEHFAQAHAA